MFKKLLIYLLVGVLIFFGYFLLDDEDLDYEEDNDYTPSVQIGSSSDPDQTWSIYWYLCGSDLESEIGSASDDLEELMSVQLPDNVQVVIQTGGAYMWMNDFVDSDVIQRYLYDSSGLHLVDEQPQSNMGSVDTLTDFLYFCASEYPADRTMAIFWNHGGGSVSGASFDENYDYDSLTLNEFFEGFSNVYNLDYENPPLDIIGFDTCLMATVDTAATFSPIARYLVASEENEPATGWNYSGFMQALADDPGMDGARLGQHICDSYMDSLGWFTIDETTLSVVDLSRLEPLLDAYEKMGVEALTYSLENPYFLSEFAREAESSENYGGNTKDTGYANMVDLGHLAENCSDLLPSTSRAVIDALKHAVIYKVNGEYRDHSSGLSCYYSYNGDYDDLEGFYEQGYSESFKYLFDYALFGDMSDDGYDYIANIGFEPSELPYVPDLESDALDEYPLYIDDDGSVVLAIDQDTLNMLKGVYFYLALVDPETGTIIMLGQDNNIYQDWENGIFKDNFNDQWGTIDQIPVYMEIAYEADDYTRYNVPILLNGEEYNHSVVYDYDDGEYYILGARKGLDEHGMADKNLIQLQPGDEITALHYVGYPDQDELELVPTQSLTVTEDTRFTDEMLGDGTFVMMFEMVDAKNNELSSACPV